ncbi:MAG: hypothetical protein VCD66_11340 [Alphaproteobacteria bacterium]
MAVRLFAMTCGWLSVPMRVVLDGEEGELRVPVPCYLIDHPKGQVLFDSGIHTDLQDPQDDRAALLVKRFKAEFKVGEELEQFSINRGRFRARSDWFNCSILKSLSAFSSNALWARAWNTLMSILKKCVIWSISTCISIMRAATIRSRTRNW